MSLRRRAVWIALWIVSLIATAGLVQAQTRSPDPMLLMQPMIVSGEDVGFRIQGYGLTAAIGRLVVRVNGRWQQTQLAPDPDGKVTGGG